jgi:hypothetical protein
MIQESRDYPGMYMCVYPHIVVLFVEIKEGQVRCGEHSDNSDIISKIGKIKKIYEIIISKSMNSILIRCFRRAI